MATKTKKTVPTYVQITEVLHKVFLLMQVELDDWQETEAAVKGFLEAKLIRFKDSDEIMADIEADLKYTEGFRIEASLEEHEEYQYLLVNSTEDLWERRCNNNAVFANENEFIKLTAPLLDFSKAKF